jgi:hypothetical protein
MRQALIRQTQESGVPRANPENLQSVQRFGPAQFSPTSSISGI